METTEKPKGRSNPGTESSPNPAKMFIQWKSKDAQFSYYDKESKEDDKNVLLGKTFSFIPLYVCNTVKGYNHKKGKTFMANEVKNITEEPLTVTSYNNTTKEKKVEYKGLYADIKDDFDQNIKFTVSVYAGIKDDKGKLKLVNIQLNGAGLHHWFDFTKKNDIWKNAVKVTKTTSEKNGDVTYKAPAYEAMKISEEMDAEAGVLQEEITAYLTEYFAKNTGSSERKVNENQDNGLNKKSTKEGTKKQSDSKEKDYSDPDENPFGDADEDVPF